MNENVEQSVIHAFQNLMYVWFKLAISVTEYFLSMYSFHFFLQFLSSLLNENEKF